jgi:hypothetical protein
MALLHRLDQRIDAPISPPQRKLQPVGGGIDGKDDAHGRIR